MKRLIALALSLSMAVSLTACGGGDDAAGGDSGSRSLTVSGQPYSHTLPAYIGLEEGQFEDVGLDVELIMFTGGNVQNEALGAGEWDVGCYGSPPSITGGIAYGAKVIGFGSPDTEAVTIWARSDSDIAQIQGQVAGYDEIYGNADTWRGKTILCPLGTSAHFTLVATLEKLGLTTEDVSIIDMGVAQAYTAFKAGEADIVCLWDPQGFDAENEDWVCISSGKATGEDQPTVIVAAEEAIETKHDEILDFLDCYYQICEKYADDLDAYGQYMMDIGLDNGVEQTLEIATRCAEKRPLSTLDDEIEWFSGEKGTRYVDTTMENLMDFFVQTGSIEESDKQYLIENNFIDDTFIRELAERHGKTMN